MYYLYYCNSSYQLINVLNLHWHRRFSNFENIKNYTADLIMLNAYDGAEEVYKILKENNVFNNIRLVNRVRIKGNFHSLKVARDIVFPKSFLERDYQFANVKNRYDYICAPKFNRLVAALWQVNKKAKLQMHEDGVGTYICDMGNDMLPRTYKLLYKYFNNGKDFGCIDSIYVNRKELYSNTNPELIREIPTISKEYMKELLNIFSMFSINEDNNKNIYWLSQIMFKESSKNSINEILSSLYKNREKVVYCPHPRNPIETSYDFDKSIEKQIWELKVLNNKNINDCCLISSHSTACLTPYILYGFEPYIILTYNMIDKSDIANKENFDLFIEKVKGYYKDSKKIMVPKNIEEFNDCLEMFNKIN